MDAIISIVDVAAAFALIVWLSMKIKNKRKKLNAEMDVQLGTTQINFLRSKSKELSMPDNRMNISMLSRLNKLEKKLQTTSACTMTGTELTTVHFVHIFMELFVETVHSIVIATTFNAEDAKSKSVRLADSTEKLIETL